MSYNQGERCVELNGFAAPIVEGSDSIPQSVTVWLQADVIGYAYPKMESLSILAEGTMSTSGSDLEGHGDLHTPVGGISFGIVDQCGS